MTNVSASPNPADGPRRPAPPGDVFVSYARADFNFVQGLTATLSSSGFRPWVDVEGLYAGEEFWPEIAKAIDACAVLLFVLTPKSAASPHCRKELEWAVARGKRIVPLSRRDVDAALLPEELARRQWVFA